jgi:hypothetical protein
MQPPTSSSKNVTAEIRRTTNRLKYDRVNSIPKNLTCPRVNKVQLFLNNVCAGNSARSYYIESNGWRPPDPSRCTRPYFHQLISGIVDGIIDPALQLNQSHGSDPKIFLARA